MSWNTTSWRCHLNKTAHCHHRCRGEYEAAVRLGKLRENILEMIRFGENWFVKDFFFVWTDRDMMLAAEVSSKNSLWFWWLLDDSRQSLNYLCQGVYPVPWEIQIHSFEWDILFISIYLCIPNSLPASNHSVAYTALILLPAKPSAMTYDNILKKILMVLLKTN